MGFQYGFSSHPYDRQLTALIAGFLPEWYVHDEILGYDVEKHVGSHLGVALDRL